MYSINRNTGLPPARKNEPKYPWRQLKVKDSFEVPISDTAFHSIRTTAKKAETRTGAHYSVRQVRDRNDQVTAMRVTRIS